MKMMEKSEAKILQGVLWFLGVPKTIFVIRLFFELMWHVLLPLNNSISDNQAGVCLFLI